MAVLRLAHLAILGILNTAVSSSRLTTIPTIPFQPAGHGVIPIASLDSIIVDPAFANVVDENGETLIPPTLTEFAHTFASDLQEVWGHDFHVSEGSKVKRNSIFLTLDEHADYHYAGGDVSTEGYTVEISSCGITIRGASPLGVWWGTRTLIQQAVLGDGKLSQGSVTDSPGWKTRGVFLDGGRHYYPPEFLVDLCSYASFFKQNVLHLHLSDNLFNNVDIYTRERSLELYARFRLWSDSPSVAGLNLHKNESYTKDVFKSIQSSCAARGVTLIPEIEAPGHALVIVQWKPQLGLSDLSLLNISHPETMPTMKTIWGEFLDWFDCKTMHIGADEYTAGADDYNNYVREMADFIRTNGNKSTRIWGTFPPKPEYDNIYKNVSIQHWEFFEDNPLHDYIENGYGVMNSDDYFYVVNKWSGSYPQSIDPAKAFSVPAGGPWAPYVFDTHNSSDNPDKSNPLVLGAIAALWNDYGPNATVYSEAYYALRDGLPAVADKQWGGDLQLDEFNKVFDILHAAIPAQNLDRTIPSKTPTILQYGVDHGKKDIAKNGKVTDESGNKYDGTTNCAQTSENTIVISPGCSIKTPLSSKGRDYTLSLRLFIDGIPGPHQGSHDATLITGGDSTLMLTPTITLFASGNYYRSNTTVPLNTWVDLSIIGRGNQTFASVKQAKLGTPLPKPGSMTAGADEFLAILGINGDSFVWAPIAVEAPIAEVAGPNAGWTGQFAGMILSSEA